MRIDLFLKLSRLVRRRSAAREMIELGAVKLNGRLVRPSAEVRADDKIEVAYPGRLLLVQVVTVEGFLGKNSDPPVLILEDKRLGLDREQLLKGPIAEEKSIREDVWQMKKIVSTPTAPAAIGPYNQGVWFGNLLFLSGQIPINPETGAMVEVDAAAQAEQVLKNIGAILASQGLSFRDVLKATVFSTDMGMFSRVNEVYARYFNEEAPARSFVEVSALPKGALVEIEVVAGRS